MTDWSAIRAEYEQGTSLRDIVAAHGSSIATISRVARHDNWIRPVKPLETRTVKRETPVSPKPLSPVSMPMDAVSIARTGLRQLAQHLQAEEILPIASHKSLSDALAQYVKVLLVAPQETEVREGLLIPLDGISDHTRREIRRLLLEDAEQREVS